jgi:predicted ArsR family transcriptional regulator
MPSGDLADEIGATRSGTSQHLSVLKNEGLLNARSDWQYVHYSLGMAPMPGFTN